MFSISDKQLDFILDDIERKGIVTEDVKYNILDHVCCIIENKMESKGNFEKVYEDTIAQFYLKELSEIEDETQKLLTFKHYYAMKRTLKISGIISIILIILGIIFKSLHLPGAGALIVLSLAFFSLFFIPLNIVLKFQDDQEKSNRLMMTIGMLTASGATIGVLFKIMHWPYANMLMLTSLLVFILVFIPIYFVVKYKDPETKFNAIINTAFMIGAAGMLFALINLGYSKNTEQLKEEVEEYQQISPLDSLQSSIISFSELNEKS